MNAAAVGVMTELPDLVLAYGVSDEFRCVASQRVDFSKVSRRAGSGGERSFGASSFYNFNAYRNVSVSYSTRIALCLNGERGK